MTEVVEEDKKVVRDPLTRMPALAAVVTPGTLPPSLGTLPGGGNPLTDDFLCTATVPPPRFPLPCR